MEKDNILDEEILEESLASLFLQIDAQGQMRTTLTGHPMMLLGALEVLRDHIKQDVDDGLRESFDDTLH